MENARENILTGFSCAAVLCGIFCAIDMQITVECDFNLCSFQNAAVRRRSKKRKKKSGIFAAP
jgi:hypothetical protein